MPVELGERSKYEILMILSASQRQYFILCLVGMIIGGVLSLSGFVLVLLGISGSIDWVVQAKDFASRLTNASPGIVFCVAGMTVVWRFKPRTTDSLEITAAEPGLFRYDRTQ